MGPIQRRIRAVEQRRAAADVAPVERVVVVESAGQPHASVVRESPFARRIRERSVPTGGTARLVEE